MKLIRIERAKDRRERPWLEVFPSTPDIPDPLPVE